jgi:membrane-associated phospholipid phosphatase
VGCCLILTCEMLGTNCHAKPQEQPVSKAPVADTQPDTAKELDLPEELKFEIQKSDRYEDRKNALGISFVKNLFSDQKAIWTSPFHLHWADGSWLFPLTTVTGGLFLADRAVPPALSSNPNTLSHYRNFSNYGVYSLVGAGGGLYLWSKLSRDDHQREAGVLAGEAAINSFAVDTVFKYSFGRERPDQGRGLGNFFQHGVSFPSDHSVVAWSIASVLAHEYPGPITKILAYGVATAVSVSRVEAGEHFPSDVVVGGAVGWLIGRQVYRAHHDSNFGGAVPGNLSGNEEDEGHRDRRNIGSPFVPLDSWVYPAIERLAALGYIRTAIIGIKPWTRTECARLIEEAGEESQNHKVVSQEAAALRTRLQKEFAYELGLLNGGRNLTANVESVYTRAVSISGPPLTDGYHFGQTVSYDFGRPFERGTNGQAGGSFSVAAGPVALFVRAEYQHAPSAPALSDAVRNIINLRDAMPLADIRPGPLAPINRARLIDTYATVNLDNWQLVVGKQSFSWTPGPDGSMLWSTNSEPINMVRLVNPEPFHLPGFLEHIGGIRIDQFFGRLEGGAFVPRPFFYGQKVDFQPFPWLELGFARTTAIGGTGGEPLTATSLVHSVFAVPLASVGGVPGDNDSEMDWTFYVPKVRNYIVLYGDSYANDDILPIERPARNPWHPGLYITRIPGVAKLDFRMQGVSSEAPGRVGGAGNGGELNYWDGAYRDGNTNNGQLTGNTVGRDGRAIQCWLRYWISPRNTVELTYKHNTVAQDFIPGGGAWQDYALHSEIYMQNGFYVKSELQYEHISRYPILFSNPQANVTAIVELGFAPERKK